MISDHESSRSNTDLPTRDTRSHLPLVMAVVTLVILLLGLGIGFSIPYGGPLSAASRLTQAVSTGEPPSSASGAEIPGTTPTAASDKPSSGSWLKVEPEKWDFGEVNATDVVTHSFQLRNNGSGDLVINSVTTSCGCTKAKVAQKILAPGESTEMTVTYDPSHHSKITPGQARRLVYIRSNDPEAPEIVIPITAFIVKAPPADSTSTPQQGG